MRYTSERVRFFTIVLLVLCLPGTSYVVAQEWRVNDLPFIGPVPQYSSPRTNRYPLNEETVQDDLKEESKRATASSTEEKEPEKNPVKKKIEPHYGLDYSVYRDKNLLPIDPRKPCNRCVRPQGECSCHLPGVGGRPYMKSEPGGCTCSKKGPPRHPDFSLHWPRPFSAKLDERNPEKAAARYASCQKKRAVDVFDSLSKFKLSNYKRTDNGYCGPLSDPYGCLGESKQQVSRVTGVGYRFPSEPVSR